MKNLLWRARIVFPVSNYLFFYLSFHVFSHPNSVMHGPYTFVPAHDPFFGHTVKPRYSVLENLVPLLKVSSHRPHCSSLCTQIQLCLQRPYDMNGRFQMQEGFTERDECKPVLLRLSLAGNLVKPLMSLYETERRERGCGVHVPVFLSFHPFFSLFHLFKRLFLSLSSSLLVLTCPCTVLS